jgi:hypothetical protein
LDTFYVINPDYTCWQNLRAVADFTFYLLVNALSAMAALRRFYQSKKERKATLGGVDGNEVGEDAGKVVVPENGIAEADDPDGEYQQLVVADQVADQVLKFEGGHAQRLYIRSSAKFLMGFDGALHFLEGRQGLVFHPENGIPKRAAQQEYYDQHQAQQ